MYLRIQVWVCAGGQHPVVRHGDGLQADPAARRQQPVERARSTRPVALADRLDHLARRRWRRTALDVAVVAQFARSPGGQPGRGDPLCGERAAVLTRSSIGDHGAPRLAARSASSPQPVPISSSRVPGPSPARSSRRSILRRCAAPAGARLPPAGLLCPVEQGRGVGHGLVEEEREQLVGQVVVLAHVLAGTFSCLPVGGRRAADDDRAQPLQPGRDEVGDVRRPGRSAARSGRRAVPVAGHVGLAEADQAARRPTAGRTPLAGAGP